MIAEGTQSSLELVNLNSALVYELEITDECGTSTQMVSISDPLAVSAEIQGEFLVSIEEGSTQMNYQANSNNAISHEWYLDGELMGSGDNLNLEFNETGDYLLTLNSIGAACSNSTSEWIQVDQANGINTNERADFTVQVTNDQFILTGEFKQSNLDVYNSTGKLILNTNISGNQVFIPIGTLSAGIYLVQIDGFTQTVFVGQTK